MAGPLTSALVTDQPFAELPADISLTREEVGIVLFALDVLEQADVDPVGAERVRRAVRLLTAKLWPELGDILDDEGPQ